jgi:hypothetical protein
MSSQFNEVEDPLAPFRGLLAALLCSAILDLALIYLTQQLLA